MVWTKRESYEIKRLLLVLICSLHYCHSNLPKSKVNFWRFSTKTWNQWVDTLLCYQRSSHYFQSSDFDVQKYCTGNRKWWNQWGWGSGDGNDHNSKPRSLLHKYSRSHCWVSKGDCTTGVPKSNTMIHPSTTFLSTSIIISWWFNQNVQEYSTNGVPCPCTSKYRWILSHW